MYYNPKFTNITEKERVKLYNEVWEEPMKIVAERYGVSDTTLRKHCRKLDIPLPDSGYWAKLKYGQKVVKKRLPNVTKEVSKYVREYIIKYREDLDDMSDEELLLDKEFNLLTEETIEYIKDQCSKIKVTGQLRNPCLEITNHKEEMEIRKKRDKELGTDVNGVRYYYKIDNKYGEKKSVLPINVSQGNLNRAYRIFDTLIKVLPDFEAWLRVGDHNRIWTNPPKDKATVSIIKSHFDVSINEIKNSLFLNIDGVFKFSDLKDNPLENQLGSIIYKLIVEGNKRYAKLLVEYREEERNWQKQLIIREDEKRKRKLKELRENRLEETKLLLISADDWVMADKLRKFLDAMEEKIQDIKDDEKQEKLLSWITEQRKKADWLDPLIYVEDQQLGVGPFIINEIIKDNDVKE